MKDAPRCCSEVWHGAQGSTVFDTIQRQEELNHWDLECHRLGGGVFKGVIYTVSRYSEIPQVPTLCGVTSSRHDRNMTGTNTLQQEKFKYLVPVGRIELLKGEIDRTVAGPLLHQK